MIISKSSSLIFSESCLESFNKSSRFFSFVNHDLMFKIITLGDSGVGKTSIINRYAKNIFNENNASTVGVNFVIKQLKITSLIKNKNLH